MVALRFDPSSPAKAPIPLILRTFSAFMASRIVASSVKARASESRKFSFRLRARTPRPNASFTLCHSNRLAKACLATVMFPVKTPPTVVSKAPVMVVMLLPMAFTTCVRGPLKMELIQYSLIIANILLP